ncbi:MAG: HEAT repeat domain-containing protein [Limnospira sp.]
MELKQIETYIDSPNPQDRMRAIVALRHHASDAVVPLLMRRVSDKEFIIRSFVAMGLGNQQTEQAFDALIDLIEYDGDYNVRAEAANSLVKYGDRALPAVVKLFERDSNWLVRQSILAAVSEADRPEILIKLCRLGIAGEDTVVKQAAIANLGRLHGTPQAEEALEILLSLATDEAVEVRAQVARVLGFFQESEAQAALMELRSDRDYRVVGASLEALL